MGDKIKSTSSVTREIPMKTTENYKYISIKLAKIKIWESLVFGDNVRYCLLKLKTGIHCDSAIPLLRGKYTIETMDT